MRSRVRLSTIFAAVAAAITFACASAQADDANDTARTTARARAQEGDAAFAGGRCDKAIPLWIEANHAFSATTIELRIAHCQALVGKVVDAASTLQHIAETNLAADAPQPFIDAKAQATSELPTVRERIATLILDARLGTPLTEITIDDEPLPLTERSFKVDPGHHRVRLRSQTTDAERQLDFKDGETKTFKFETKLVAAPEGPHVLRNAGLVLGGIGAVTLITGTIFGITSLSTKSTLDTDCPTRSTCPADDQSKISKLKTDSLLTDLFLGGGIVFAGASAFLLVRDAKTERPGPSPQFILTGRGGAVRWAF
jgi:hypothetical protein